MGLFLCGEHGAGCLRDRCVKRAHDVRMALNGVCGDEPSLPIASLIAAGRRGGAVRRPDATESCPRPRGSRRADYRDKPRVD